MITLYTQPNCLPCKRVAKKLDEAGIKYETVDLSTDVLAKDFVQRAYNAKSTPIVADDVTGEVIVGYEPTQLKKFIEERSLPLLDTEHIHDYVYEGEE